jgi:urease accessory protein UreF
MITTYASYRVAQVAGDFEPVAEAVRTFEVTKGTEVTRDRQKKCGAEWKEAKAAGKVEKGTTWQKYWSACNKRLKAASK